MTSTLGSAGAGAHPPGPVAVTRWRSVLIAGHAGTASAMRGSARGISPAAQLAVVLRRAGKEARQRAGCGS
jgi:hypothetical protein